MLCINSEQEEELCVNHYEAHLYFKLGSVSTHCLNELLLKCHEHVRVHK